MADDAYAREKNGLIALLLVAIGLLVAVLATQQPQRWEGKSTGWGPGNTTVSDCGFLNGDNQTFNVSGNLTISGATCITFNGTNQTLNCHGYTLTGNATASTYGVYSTKLQSNLMNCLARNFTHGVYFNGADNGSITNVQANTTGSSSNGIYLAGGANYNTITDSNGSHDGGGNFGSGIMIDSSNFNVLSGVRGVTKVSSTSRSGIRLSSASNNTLYNCTGNATGSSTAGITLVSSSNGNLISNCAGQSLLYRAISLSSSSNNTVANGTFTSNSSSRTLDLQSSDGNAIYNNTLTNINPLGLLAFLDSGSNGNLFYWNNFTTFSGIYMNDTNGSNSYNSTEGNRWANVVNGSVAINGSTASSGFAGLYVGSQGAGYPYTNTTSAGKFACNFAGCSDYAPLTPTFGAAANVTINITSIDVKPSVAYAITNLSCNLTIASSEEPVNVYGNWSRNGAILPAFEFSGEFSVGVEVNVSTLPSGNFWKGDNVSCAAKACDSVGCSNLASSANLTISNSIPTIANQTTVQNASAGHQFTASAAATDYDNATDIKAVNASSTSGSCSGVANSSSGYSFNATLNCSATAPGNTTLVIGFTDKSDAYVATNPVNTGYPDHAASLAMPSVTPSQPSNSSILTCNPGLWSDIDYDSENTTNRSWAWYRNGTLMAGNTSQTLNLSMIAPSVGENFSCFQNTSAQNWTSSRAWNWSLNATVGLKNLTQNLPRQVFLPANRTAQNVSLHGQSQSQPFYNISAGSYPVVASVAISGNSTGVTIRCSKYFNQSGISAIPHDFNYSSAGQLFCWADFNATSITGKFNITVT